jgi:uncharacterized protein YggT (Ycf19 family)
MDWLNLLLNVAGLLLWLSWQARSFAIATRPAHPALLWTPGGASDRRTRPWYFLAGLGGLLLLRGLLYWQIGPALNWTGTVNAGAVTFPFRSDHLGKMLLFSGISFGVLLWGFYVWLLLLAMANRNAPEQDPWQQMVRLHLGWIDRWPTLVKLLLPAFGGMLLWALLLPVLSGVGIMSRSDSVALFWQRALVLGLDGYVTWRLLLILVFALHLLNTYVYLGESPLWNFVNRVARNSLQPLGRWRFQWGRVDFAPLIAIGLVSLLAELAAHGLRLLYLRLPL